MSYFCIGLKIMRLFLVDYSDMINEINITEGKYESILNKFHLTWQTNIFVYLVENSYYNKTKKTPNFYSKVTS